ncbi:MAG: sigma-54-dependent Fis family transcriptional regulator [Lentisphaerae bacterium]|jgi:two-component system response regulator AtoC|nr:sigma-54-dependent Fis family transcriptional regulator [Lentisphaerota bacterium]
MTSYSVLIVDDERNTREGLGRALRRDYKVHLAENAAAAFAALQTNNVDVMLSDVRMPGMDGLELLTGVRKKYPDVICIMLTAYGSVETAVEAMKLGAVDFLTKPVNLDHLDMILEKAIRQRNLESENTSLKLQLDSKYGLENMVGNSPIMKKLFDTIHHAAPTQATVLIEGASGTGKELVAQAIHRLSKRSDGPFVAVHCAALSSSLLESELFGHEKGSFTGATSQRKGRFEMADGGTLFLDEISEIDQFVQIKLLRILEERKFERVGGTETLEVNIRIVAATNRDLRQYVDDGKFREDLYFRLDVVRINMPPLSERGDDIVILSDRFMREFSEINGRNIQRIEPDAMKMLYAYSWPGNVRELRNTIEKMVVLAHGETLTADDVPENIKLEFFENGHQDKTLEIDTLTDASGTGTHTSAGVVSFAEAEKRGIQRALAASKGNKTKAAELLGISRRTLHRKLKEWEEEAAE